MLDFGAPPQRVIEIVLTGGSCAGKTSALEMVARSLRERDHSVLCAPEAVTLLVTSGIPKIGDISRSGMDQACMFQRQVFTLQRQFRRIYRGLAKTFMSDTVVILYDRGELDGFVYHDHDCYRDLVASEATSLAEIRDSYDAVIHLVTAADGAVEAFSRATNAARWDTAEEAVDFDRKLLRAWGGHPQHAVIDNTTDFLGKMDRLVQTVLALIELEPLRIAAVG